MIFQKNKGEKYILISKFERNFNSDMQLPDSISSGSMVLVSELFFLHACYLGRRRDSPFFSGTHWLSLDSAGQGNRHIK